MLLTQLRTFAYADKRREAQRVAALAREDAAPAPPPRAAPAKKQEGAWSEQKRRKEARDVRREKKERKRRWLHEQASAPAPVSPSDASDEEDWAAEERAVKKMKQGKLEPEAFDATFFSAM